MFLNKLQQSLRSNQQRSLFWSGVGDIVTAFQASENLFVMENSPLVALVNDLMFCGSDDPNGDGVGNPCVYGDIDPVSGVWHGTWVSYWCVRNLSTSSCRTRFF